MKIVIISDLHGNYEALRALPGTYNELWVLGDLVNYGPEPGAVIDFVKEKAPIVVRGNHDHSIGYDEDPRCTARYQKMAGTTRRYTASVLNEEQKRFLRDLPFEGNSGVKILASISVMRNPRILCTVIARQILPTGSVKFGWFPLTRFWLVTRIRRLCAASESASLSIQAALASLTPENPTRATRSDDGSFQLKSYPYSVDRTIDRRQAVSLPQDVKQDLATILRRGLDEVIQA